MTPVVRRPQPNIGGVSLWKVGCLGLIVVLGFAFLAFNESVGTSSGDIVIDGIKCGGMVNNGYHVHAHLTVFNRNKRVFIPLGIGKSKYRCYYQLHNHGGDGIIHIESRDPIYIPAQVYIPSRSVIEEGFPVAG